jgi:hypothetical protein
VVNVVCADRIKASCASGVHDRVVGGTEEDHSMNFLSIRCGLDVIVAFGAPFCLGSVCGNYFRLASFWAAQEPSGRFFNLSDCPKSYRKVRMGVREFSKVLVENRDDGREAQKKKN